ncbi:hypothetical protein B0H14DRAFT_3496503 [Mycena olivaceomarginata]|nr:hypothetical protein B0H14DRAFT_3496503 [Mycena olivaceomarginata]
MSEIEDLWQGIIGGMSLEVVERACAEPDLLQHLRDLIELEGEAEVEVAVADANLCTAQDDMVEATNRRDQIVELCQRFERGNLEPMDYVDAVDLLHRTVSPDADDVPDERLDSGDESEGGDGSEEPEAAAETRKKRKGKGKAKAAPKKVRVDREEEHEERDGSLRACDRCKLHRILGVVLPKQTACDGCHKKKGSRVTEALTELGRTGAIAHRLESQVSSWHRQVDSHTGEIVPEISPFEEMRHGLVNTQRRLHELERCEEERERKRKRRWEARAARAAGNKPEEAGESQRGEGSGRAGRSVSRSARPSSRPARSRSRTGVALLAPIVPVVSPVDDTSLIRMTIKKEHKEANDAALTKIKNRGLERAARKLERKEQIAREEAEKKEKKRLETERQKAAIDAELQALMAKKAELNAPVELKEEPVEEMVVSAEFLADFSCPAGFHMEGGYLVVDEDSEVNTNIDYELEYD